MRVIKMCWLALINSLNIFGNKRQHQIDKYKSNQQRINGSELSTPQKKNSSFCLQSILNRLSDDELNNHRLKQKQSDKKKSN